MKPNGNGKHAPGQDLVAAAYDATPAPSETPMETSPVTNGAGKPAKAKPDTAGTRWRRLPKSESTKLRRDMRSALKTQFDGSHKELAAAVGLSPGGLRRLFRLPNAVISERTQQLFLKNVKQEKEPAPPAHWNVDSPRSALPPGPLKAFQKELRQVMYDHGPDAVARGMGVNKSTLWTILRGQATYASHAKFAKYRAGSGKKDPHMFIGDDGGAPRAPKRLLNNQYGPASAPPTELAEMQQLDLYAVAGKLLSAGHAQEAHVLSLVMRLSESVPFKVISETLSTLLPPAS